MHPQVIVRNALEKKLDMIAICDHNASANAPYVIAAARHTGLTVLPGMEITTCEEVHLLALFESLSSLFKLQALIDAHLFGKNNEDRFGVQAIVNENGEVEGLNEQLLIGATDLSIDVLVEAIHREEGLAIPAHIDRESFSVLSQLGFIDESAGFDALEISKLTGLPKARQNYSELARYPFVTSSDAHFVRDIGTSPTQIQMAAPTFQEFNLALSAQNGRRIIETPC